ncbi:hypothetical protein Tdes44962_MAKER06049 [Teratosphaeria destructans]|uniref:Uncharacterized protein n=1 Tax=Teratosphaeria destructans TaxID=418781 RepID=A0A9W7VXY7_9PEZI|nr:hypothetical protein Tdes44962_MAKER06049 [Teratosphaeria destructans]
MREVGTSFGGGIRIVRAARVIVAFEKDALHIWVDVAFAFRLGLIRLITVIAPGNAGEERQVERHGEE